MNKLTQARRLDTTIRVEIGKKRRSQWILAKAFYEFNQVQGWQRLGYYTQQDYLNTLDITRTIYFRYVRVWRTFAGVVTQMDMDNIDFSKLSIAAAAADSGVVSRRKALDQCRTMTARDLRTVYGQRRGVRLLSASDVGIASVMTVLLALLEDPTIQDSQARAWAIDLCNTIARPVANSKL